MVWATARTRRLALRSGRPATAERSPRRLRGRALLAQDRIGPGHKANPLHAFPLVETCPSRTVPAKIPKVALTSCLPSASTLYLVCFAHCPIRLELSCHSCSEIVQVPTRSEKNARRFLGNVLVIGAVDRPKPTLCWSCFPRIRADGRSALDQRQHLVAGCKPSDVVALRLEQDASNGRSAA